MELLDVDTALQPVWWFQYQTKIIVSIFKEITLQNKKSGYYYLLK